MPIVEITSNDHIPRTGSRLYRIIDRQTGNSVMEGRDAMLLLFVRLHPDELRLETSDDDGRTWQEFPA